MKLQPSLAGSSTHGISLTLCPRADSVWTGYASLQLTQSRSTNLFTSPCLPAPLQLISSVLILSLLICLSGSRAHTPGVAASDIVPCR